MKKFRLPLWALASLAAVLAVLVVLLANQGAVDRILAMTGLERVLYPKGKNSTIALLEPVVTQPAVLLDPLPSATPPPDETAAAPTDQDAPDAEPSSPPEPPLPSTPNTYRLYFLKLSPEGRLEPASFSRQLPAGATPLAATIKALLLGPTLQDKAQGALSLMPAGTKLLSVRIKDRIALLSFSEEFELNTLGQEGLAGQLKEVVWTATQFESIDAVQILIAGQYRETLGEPGLAISAPLSRANVP